MVNWETAARRLWNMLDDIDTLDDACRGNDAEFRKRAREKAKGRFNFADSDGYRLSWKPFQSYLRAPALETVRKARDAAEQWTLHKKVDMSTVVESLAKLVERLLEDIDRTPKEVYLLWQNDMVLGVFPTQDLAELAAGAVRRTQHGNWVGKAPRWYQKEGPIARLEVDRRDIREHTTKKAG